MRYTHQSKIVGNGITRYNLSDEGLMLTHRDVHRLWRENECFVRFYTQLIVDAGYSGFCWETPAVTLQTLDDKHEFVIVRSDVHASIQQNWMPFTEHFNKVREAGLAVSFLNLGKNGMMVAPVPDRSFDGGSLASFLKSASDERVQALWQLVGKEISSKISNSPIWLSTAGLGVSWLHVRLDARPKYYRYQLYKNEGK